MALAAWRCFAGQDPAQPTTLPAASWAAGSRSAAGEEVAIFSGGCFWGVQAVFQHMKGVKSAVSGYTGGSLKNPSYEQVSTGTTGHAESVRITFDPAQVSVRRSAARVLLGRHRSYRAQLSRSRSWHAVSVGDLVHHAGAAARGQGVHRSAAKAKVYQNKIVTEVKPAQAFYNAEGYHQDYATLHPDRWLHRVQRRAQGRRTSRSCSPRCIAISQSWSARRSLRAS